MIGKNEKLRKISDDAFQEAVPPEDRNRPLEWRRSFNFVSLPLRNVEVVNSCTVHDTEFRLDFEKPADPISLLKTNITDSIVIVGILDEDRVRDSFYFAVENKAEEGIYSLEKARGKTQIILKPGEPTEANESGVPQGLYWGNVFRMNDEAGDYGLCFELSIPRDQMGSLLTALREAESPAVEIGAHLLSFTFEVDDALREYYDPRDFVVSDFSLCFVSRVGVTSKVGQHYIRTDPEVECEGGVTPNLEALTQEQRSHQDLLRVLLSHSKPLSSLVTAIWVLIIVIALHAFYS